MDFRVLGPVAVKLNDGTDLALQPRRRVLLAALLLDAGSVLSVDYLMRCLWDEQPPRSALNALHVHVCQLRRQLGCAVTDGGERTGPTLITMGTGYVLNLGGARCDLQEFHRSLASARQLQRRGGKDPETVVAYYRHALAAWQGDPLANVQSEHLARRAQALVNHRLWAIEELIDVELALGHGASLVAELTDLVAAHPERERFVAQLMTALYHAGRTGEALAAFRSARQAFVAQLGIEPGPQVQRVHQSILRGDPAIVPPGGSVRCSSKPSCSTTGAVRCRQW